MVVQPSVSYIEYDASLKVKTGDIITFPNFEEGNLSPKSYNGTESGYKSDDDLTLPPLISEMKFHRAMNLMLNLCLRIC